MISKILTQTLRNIADQLDAGNCNLQEEEMLKIIEFTGKLTRKTKIMHIIF